MNNFVTSRILQKSKVVLLITYFFIVLFTYAAISKILDFNTFKFQLAQSPTLSAFATSIAWSTPLLEMLIVILLLINRTKKLGLLSAFFMMVLFTSYIIIILKFSDYIPCSCGGVLEKMTWTQHLYFNLFFIVIAALALIIGAKQNKAKTLIRLLLLSFIAISSITVLFHLSENKMHKNNAFQRRFVPHPLKLKRAINLDYNSYYFAGAFGSHLYLGNVTAPLNMIIIDTTLQNKTSHIIKIDAMDLPYQRIQLSIQPPNFYVSDGNVPIILKGLTSQWNAHTHLKNEFYFSSLIPYSETEFIFKTIDGTTKKPIIAKYLNNTVNSQKLIKNFNLLENQNKNLLTSNGQLLYNTNSKNLIYIYHYINKYIIFNNDLKKIANGKTIDTISSAQIKLIQNPTNNKTKVTGASIIVNKYATIGKNLLCVISNRLGAFEKSESLDRATIVDVYNLTNQTYQFSFYIYNYKNQAVSQFIIHNNNLFAIMENYLVQYHLNPVYFNSEQKLK